MNALGITRAARGHQRVRLRGSEGRPGAPRRPLAGFSLIELLLVMAVLVVAFLALSQSLVASVRMTSVHRETALATDGIGEMIETLQGVEDFDLVYRLYNADPGDDPGPGPAPGSGFAVAGLGAVDGDPDGLVGEIVFPTVASAFGLELREDVVDPALGMPRDLNGNGLVDNYAIAPDEYRLLPVLVRLRWNGVTGERTMVGRTLIADR